MLSISTSFPCLPIMGEVCLLKKSALEQKRLSSESLSNSDVLEQGVGKLQPWGQIQPTAGFHVLFLHLNENFNFKKYLYICIFGCAGSLLLQVDFLWLQRAGATL